MRKRIEDLDTIILSQAFAKALDVPIRWSHMIGPEIVKDLDYPNEWYAFNPAQNITDLAPYIAKRGIEVSPIMSARGVESWQAQVWRPYGIGNGDTPQLAACRAVVNAAFGDYYEVPIFPQ